MKYIIWEDGKSESSVTIDADNMSAALDSAAIEFGYLDYADMAQALNWDSDSGDGLNIKVSRDENSS